MFKRIMLTVFLLVSTVGFAQVQSGETWELVSADSSSEDFVTYECRLSVPGGWLVKVVGYAASTFAIHTTPAVSITFVPDPNHIWKLKK